MKETKTELKERVQDYIMGMVHNSFVASMEDGWSNLESPEAQEEMTTQIRRIQKLFRYDDWAGLTTNA